MIRNRLFVLVGLLVVVAAVASAVAFAGHGKKTKFDAVLNPIPHNTVADHGSNVTGTARLMVDGTRVHVIIHPAG